MLKIMIVNIIIRFQTKKNVLIIKNLVYKHERNVI